MLEQQRAGVEAGAPEPKEATVAVAERSAAAKLVAAQAVAASAVEAPKTRMEKMGPSWKVDEPALGQLRMPGLQAAQAARNQDTAMSPSASVLAAVVPTAELVVEDCIAQQRADTAAAAMPIVQELISWKDMPPKDFPSRDSADCMQLERVQLHTVALRALASCLEQKAAPDTDTDIAVNECMPAVRMGWEHNTPLAQLQGTAEEQLLVCKDKTPEAPSTQDIADTAKLCAVAASKAFWKQLTSVSSAVKHSAAISSYSPALKGEQAPFP